MPPPPAPARTAAAPVTCTPSPGTRRRNETVLVVEDDAASLDAMCRLLAARGFDVASAPSVRESMRQIGSARPNILVSDLNLLDGTGFEIIRALRDAERLGAMRVHAIAVTGVLDPDNRRRALAAGFDALLHKPVDFDRLIRVIDGVDDAAGDARDAGT